MRISDLVEFVVDCMEFLLQALNFSFKTRDDDAAVFWARPFNNALNFTDGALYLA